jgi:hypothetical protein
MVCCGLAPWRRLTTRNGSLWRGAWVRRNRSCAVRLQRALCALYCQRIAAAVADRRDGLRTQRVADRESETAQVGELLRIRSLHDVAGNRRSLRTLQDTRGGKSGRDQDDGVETERGLAADLTSAPFEVI